MIIYLPNDTAVMTILSDKDIAESISNGCLGISDFIEKNLTPNGYDLTIAEIKINGSDEAFREGTVRIPARTMAFVSTKERVRIPDDMCAQLWMRTTWMRRGLIGVFGKIDAGYEGTLTFGCYNTNDHDVEYPIGERFCQIVFETLSSASIKSYEKRSGHYQGSTGITLDPLKK